MSLHSQAKSISEAALRMVSPSSLIRSLTARNRSWFSAARRSRSRLAIAQPPVSESRDSRPGGKPYGSESPSVTNIVLLVCLVFDWPVLELLPTETLLGLLRMYDTGIADLRAMRDPAVAKL